MAPKISALLLVRLQAVMLVASGCDLNAMIMDMREPAYLDGGTDVTASAQISSATITTAATNQS
ncbi:MAG TPA: hypothetical protein VJK53_03030 [Candidatus Paceibacterota bacterium]